MLRPSPHQSSDGYFRTNRLKSEWLMGPVMSDKDPCLLPAIPASSQAVSQEGVGREVVSLPLEPHAIHGALPARNPVTVISELPHWRLLLCAIIHCSQETISPALTYSLAPENLRKHHCKLNSPNTQETQTASW